MWMQLLQAAGMPVIGEAFPLTWGESIRSANPEGFFESILRKGIYWETNPHPATGAYIDPHQSRYYAVKVFIPGLIRTDRAFMHKVIGTMRHWREYDASLKRLYAMGDDARTKVAEKGGAKKPRPVEYTSERVDPVLEWWAENFSLVSDLAIRRYPAHLVAYENTLREPDRVVTEAFEWLGKGDPKKAIEGVKPEVRTQDDSSRQQKLEIDEEPELTSTFDDLYAHVLERRALEPSFIDKLNATNDKLMPRFKAAAKAMDKARQEQRRQARKPRKDAPDR